MKGTGVMCPQHGEMTCADCVAAAAVAERKAILVLAQDLRSEHARLSHDTGCMAALMHMIAARGRVP